MSVFFFCGVICRYKCGRFWIVVFVSFRRSLCGFFDVVWGGESFIKCRVRVCDVNVGVVFVVSYVLEEGLGVSVCCSDF